MRDVRFSVTPPGNSPRPRRACDSPAGSPDSPAWAARAPGGVLGHALPPPAAGERGGPRESAGSGQTIPPPKTEQRLGPPDLSRGAPGGPRRLRRPERPFLRMPTGPAGRPAGGAPVSAPARRSAPRAARPPPGRPGSGASSPPRAGCGTRGGGEGEGASAAQRGPAEAESRARKAAEPPRPSRGSPRPWSQRGGPGARPPPQPSALPSSPRGSRRSAHRGCPLGPWASGSGVVIAAGGRRTGKPSRAAPAPQAGSGLTLVDARAAGRPQPGASPRAPPGISRACRRAGRRLPPGLARRPCAAPPARRQPVLSPREGGAGTGGAGEAGCAPGCCLPRGRRGSGHGDPRGFVARSVHVPRTLSSAKLGPEVAGPLRVGAREEPVECRVAAGLGSSENPRRAEPGQVLELRAMRRPVFRSASGHRAWKGTNAEGDSGRRELSKVWKPNGLKSDEKPRGSVASKRGANQSPAAAKRPIRGGENLGSRLQKTARERNAGLGLPLAGGSQMGLADLVTLVGVERSVDFLPVGCSGVCSAGLSVSEVGSPISEMDSGSSARGPRGH